MINRYRFEDVFDITQLSAGIILLRHNAIINGVPYNRGTAVYRYTLFGGLDLFKYVGRDIAGTFNSATNTLTILGFY